MAYSTIQLRPCKCGCGKNQTFNCGGYFYAHMPEEMKEKKGSRKEQLRKNQNTRNVIKVKMRSEIGKKDGIAAETEQDLWYRMQMASNAKICDNCGLSLEHYNEWAWRSSQNHIVDKSSLNGCPSVATHPLNCNVLGMWCCHGQWGTSFLNQSKMPCFPAAKEKFNLFKNAIHPDELKKVNPFLFITL